MDYTYIVILTRDSDVIETVVTHTGNDTVEMELGMEGYECQEFIIEISLPGNCQPAKISGKFLLGKDYCSKSSCTVFSSAADPVYPQPHGLKTFLLNTTSVAITWTHPDTSQLMVAEDEQLTYSIRGEVMDTGEPIFNYITSIRSSNTPWEVVDLSDSQCQEINISVSLLRDCRLLHTTTLLPVCESLYGLSI